MIVKNRKLQNNIAMSKTLILYNTVQYVLYSTELLTVPLKDNKSKVLSTVVVFSLMSLLPLEMMSPAEYWSTLPLLFYLFPK